MPDTWWEERNIFNVDSYSLSLTATGDRELSPVIHAGVGADPSHIQARVTSQDRWTHPPSSDFHSPIHQELVESWGVTVLSISSRSMGGVVVDPPGAGQLLYQMGGCDWTG